jgi:phospholipase/carboxylesterase
MVARSCRRDQRGTVSTGTATIAGLRTMVVGPDSDARFLVVMLHGYAMTPEDLAPFARSMGLAARFYLPEGPLESELPTRGRAWWPVDQERKARALAAGPRDLFAEHPHDTAEARDRLSAFLREVRATSGGLPVAIVGFSQGGMLACDLVLREGTPVAALALLSSSRIAADEWTPLATRVKGVPVFVAHGREDDDLAFAAGEGLRDLLASGGATITWVPFDQGHQIPLVVWRRLQKFLGAL